MFLNVKKLIDICYVIDRWMHFLLQDFINTVFFENILASLLFTEHVQMKPTRKIFIMYNTKKRSTGN